MLSSNPFATLSTSLPAAFMQGYVILMFILVVAGTLFDVVHKGSAKYFFRNMRKPKGAKPLGGGELVAIAVKTALVSLAGTLTTSGTLALQTGKALAGTLAPDGALARLTSKAVAGTLSTAGAVLKRLARALAGVLAPGGAVATELTQAGAVTGTRALTLPERSTALTLETRSRTLTVRRRSRGLTVQELD